MDAQRNGSKDPLDHEPEAVSYARALAGLSQAQVAEECGVPPKEISEIEAGARNATPIMLDKLAKALNCPRVILERRRDGAARVETEPSPVDPIRPDGTEYPANFPQPPNKPPRDTDEFTFLTFKEDTVTIWLEGRVMPFKRFRLTGADMQRLVLSYIDFRGRA